MHGGKIMTGKVQWLLEVKPAWHRTKVDACIVTGGEEMGGVNAIVFVKLCIDSMECLAYSFLFFCCLPGGFFFLFFEEELQPVHKSLSLEPPKASLLLPFWLAFLLRGLAFCL